MNYRKKGKKCNAIFRVWLNEIQVSYHNSRLCVYPSFIFGIISIVRLCTVI